MTEFRVGNITCQIAGQVVPVAEFTLADGDTIFFEQRTLLWKEPTVVLTGKNLRTAGQRTVAGMPHAVVEAQGPGRIAVTRDASGEVVVLPLHPGVETDVRGHAFLAASQNVGYDFIQIDKLASMFHGGPGGGCCSCTAAGTPSSGTWATASGSTSSLRPWSTRTRRCR
jgi:uncharacterized protein (AIM24 family)